MKKAGSVLSTFILIFLVAAVAVAALPRFFGVKIFAVLGSSMEPALHAGDMVYVVPTPAENIKPGDVVSFIIDQNLTVATHRVISKNDADRKFFTKGDANANDDGPVLYENVIGVVRFSLPAAGYLFFSFSTPQGRIIGLTLLITLVIVAFLLSGSKKKPEAEVTPGEKKTADVP